MFEWDYAAWGGQLPAVTQEIADSPTFLCRFSNLPQSTCNDGYEYTAPVGRLAAYRNGLFDMFGNVWEWTDSCMNGVLGGFDDILGQILLGGNCFEHNYLGGSFAENPNLVAREESNAPATTRSRDMGFRVVRVH